MIYSVLDLKGLVMNSYYTGQDPDAIVGNLKPEVNTGAYGFRVFLTKYYEPILALCESPINMIACLEGGNQFRIGKYSKYKQNRSKVEKDPIETAEIEQAQALVNDFLLSQGVTLIQSKGAEGDDVAAYLTCNLNSFCTVHTVDKDLLALSNDQVSVFIDGVHHKEMLQRVTIKGQREDLAVPCNLVTVYKSIVGDSSDGYGGIPRLGPAAWIALVADFGLDGMQQLDGIIKSFDKSKLKAILQVSSNKILPKLLEHWDTWLLMYDIALLHPEIVVPEWWCRVPSESRMYKVFDKAKCLDMLPQYQGDCYTATLVTKENLDEALDIISQLLPDTPFVAFDYETTDYAQVEAFQKAVKGKIFVDVLNSEITGCSFAFGRNCNHVFYFSVDHKDTENVDLSIIASLLSKIDGTVPLVAQNSAFEQTITKVRLDYEFVAPLQDTKLYAHHIDENKECGLKSLSARYLNYKQTSYKDTLAQVGAKNMSEMTGKQVLGYGADDSIVTACLYGLFTKITRLENTFEFVYTYECGAVPALVDAYIRGVKGDPVAIAKMAKEDDKIISETLVVLRDTLSEHAVQPNLAAVEAYFEDQKSFYTCQAETKESSTKESVHEHLISMKQSLRDKCFYTPQKEEPDYLPFIPTAARFKDVTDCLGLPVLEKVSRKCCEQYIIDFNAQIKTTKEQSDLVAALAPAWKGFKSRSTDEYKLLESLANKALEKYSGTKRTGTELNLNSPLQNQHLLYLFLSLPIRLRTKPQKGSLRQLNRIPGSPATDSDAIAHALANDCEGDASWKAEFLVVLQKHKSALTRKAIYWGPYPSWISGDPAGLIHGQINSCGTVTRRPTGSNPNLLQIAKGKVRSMFVPSSPDNVICSIDFSSQELRVNADYCQDATWMSAYSKDFPKDLHALTGCSVFFALLAKHKEPIGIPASAWDSSNTLKYSFFKEHQEEDSSLGKLLRKARTLGKKINFTCQFGAHDATLSRALIVSEQEAHTYIKSYFSTFPGLQPWKDRVIAEARKNLFVTNAYGSRRHCPGIRSKDYGEASRWERQVINFKIQGSCADLLKVVLTELHRQQTLQKYDAFLICPVYDELLLEIPKKNLYETITEVSELMSITLPGMSIPMVPDTSFGKNWAEQIEVGSFPSRETIAKALEKC